MINLHEKSLNDMIELKKALDMLETNEYFNRVIQEGFIQDYCLQAAHNFSNPTKSLIEGAHNPGNIMIAIGCLRTYFAKIRSDAEDAEVQLKGSE
ncbi:MAG: hypothetical protein K0U41_06635 [Gammaproteobacteria bacterium]|nr:hypothetical protein [Gammaproteobacteria bacterium]